MEFGAEIDGTEDFFQVMDNPHDNYDDCDGVIALYIKLKFIKFERLTNFKQKIL